MSALALRFDDGPHESAKYDAVLEACGPGPFASALELGGSIGVLTEMLAPRCRSLETVDVARTAAAMARRRLADIPGVHVIRGSIPDAIPDRSYDLVVASEILSHLPPDDFERTLALIRSRLIAGGRLVAVDAHPAGPVRPGACPDVLSRLRDDPWLHSISRHRVPGYQLDVLERR